MRFLLSWLALSAFSGLTFGPVLGRVLSRRDREEQPPGTTERAA